MYVYVRNNPITFDDPLGLYQTRGFDADQKALLDAAIAEALAKMNEKCNNCAGANGPKIANAIQGLTFVYKRNLKECGETGPLTFVRIRHEVALGPSSFHPGECCSLVSTVMHEAVHSMIHFDKKAYGNEEKCFGKCGQQRQEVSMRFPRPIVFSLVLLALSSPMLAQCPIGTVKVWGRVDNLPADAGSSEVLVTLEMPKGGGSKTALVSNGEFSAQIQFRNTECAILPAVGVL
jgi:hypothetical protein